MRRFDNNLTGDLTDYAKQQLANAIGTEENEETQNTDGDKLVEIFKNYDHNYAQAVYYALKDYITIEKGGNDPMERYNQTPIDDTTIKNGCYQMFKTLADAEVSKTNAHQSLKDPKIEFITCMLLTVFHIDYTKGLAAFPAIKDDVEFHNQISDVRRGMNQIHKNVYSLIVLPNKQPTQVQIAEHKIECMNQVNENIVDDVLDAYHLLDNNAESDWFRPEPESVEENAKSYGYADAFRHIPADQPQAEGAIDTEEEEDPTVMEATAKFYNILESINRY